MRVSTDLRRLVDAVAPLFAGEAEVFRGYWDAPMRTRGTDRLWIARQARKEMWDTPLGDPRGLFLGPIEELQDLFPKIDLEVPRHVILDKTRTIYEEFSHYCAFADAHDALGGADDEKLSPSGLARLPNWPENEAIRDRRAEISERFGAIGMRACLFTEGGYCTLFSEGMRLRGRGGVDDLIADACALVYEDEFGHMAKGIVGLDDAGLSAVDWVYLTELSVELQTMRIHMRNAQFGNPLSDARVAELCAGTADPIIFDFDKAAAAV